MNRKADEYADLGVESGTSPDGSGFSLRRLKTFQSFRNPVFRVYYGTMAGQWFAMSMQMMARNLLIYRITGSGAIIGVVTIAYAIPSLLVSLLGGAVADRVQKKYILLIGQMGSAVVSLVIAFALTQGYLSPQSPNSWWLLVVAAVFQGIISGFMMPSSMAIVPEIVGGEQVMNAMSLSSMGQWVFRLLGPALAGFLIDTYDFASIYYVMTGMYIIATICAALLPHTRITITRKVNPMTDIIQGAKYFRRETPILLIIVFGLFHSTSGQPFFQLVPIFTEDVLKVSAGDLGWLLTVSGVGAVIGSLVLASLPNKRRGLLLIFSGFIMGLALLAFSWSQWWYLSLGIISLVGLGPTMHNTMTVTLVQYYVDPDYRGRMQSFAMLGAGLASFTTLFAGALAGAVGIQWSISGLAVFLTLMSVIFITFAPKLRKLE